MSSEDNIPSINSYEDYKKLTPEQQAEVDSADSPDLDERLNEELNNQYINELREKEDKTDKSDKMDAA